MKENILLFSKAKLFFNRERVVLFIFAGLIIISQSIILKPHLEFGFSPDDIWLFSDFSALQPNPFLKFLQIWDAVGPHTANPLYYNGTLFSLFGFDYLSYQVAALIFKILSIISFYLLIQLVFKNYLLSFVSGLVYSMHYGSVGSMEMVTRTQDYLVITGINAFLILFYLINFKKLTSILWLILSSITLFCAFFINPIRAYPIFPFILLLTILQISRNKSISNLNNTAKNLIIIFLPYVLLFSLFGTGGVFYANTLSIIHKVFAGNLQMLLSPFTTLGSLFLTGGSLRFISSATWNLNSFLSYFLLGPLIIFGITTIILSRIISRRPLGFICYVLITNFILEFLIFLAIDAGRRLPSGLQMSYDASTYAPSAVLGIYILTLTILIFKEWLDDKQNIYLGLYLLGMSFAIIFVWCIWILQDYGYIALGINGYSTIPSMGVSTAIASIFVLAYLELKKQQNLRSQALFIFLLIIPYFFFSNDKIQTYLQKSLDNGMKASDQVSLKNKFWQLVKNQNPCDNFFFLDTKGDYPNGYFYSFIMIDRFDRWYSLYGPYHSKKNCPVALLMNDEEKLSSFYISKEDRKGFMSRDFEGKLKFFPLEKFYAFKLKDRNIFDIKEEVLKKIK